MGKPIKFFKKFMLRKRVVKRPGLVPVKVASPLRKYMLSSVDASADERRDNRESGRGGGRPRERGRGRFRGRGSRGRGRPHAREGGRGRPRGRGSRGGGRGRGIWGRWRQRPRLPVRKLVKIYVRATFNNTFFALGTFQGDILASRSSGSCGYRGKKKTPYAAQKALGGLLRQVKAFRCTGVAIVINGVGRGRRGVARSVRRYGFRILGIVDKTGVAHNGCRLRKKRRRRFMLTK